MTEQTPNNANDGGQQSGDQGRTFTQEELNAIIAERVGRERAKYGDYDDLKAAADQLKQLEDAQKTELENAQAAQARAEAAAQQAIQQANEKLMRAAFIAEAAKLGAAHPEDAYALANKTLVQIGDDGAVQGVVESVAALVQAGRLVMSGKKSAPNLDAGAGGDGKPPASAQLTPEQLEFARKLRISPEDYAKRLKKE